MILNNSYKNKIINYTGIVSGIYKNKYGIKSIYFQNQHFSKKVIVSIFPNLEETNEDK